MQRMSGGRFALIAKTHHALVDGVSGVDITTVLFDSEPDPAAVPRTGQLDRQAAARAGQAARRGAARALDRARRDDPRRPRAAARPAQGPRRRSRTRWRASARPTVAGINAPAPPSPFNVDIGPHRRYTFLDADLARFKAIKDSLGGTLNDVVLASVSLALGRYLRDHGEDTEGLVLKAMVPVSVRTRAPSAGLSETRWPRCGRRCRSASRTRPSACARSPRAMEDLKKSGQAVGAQVLTNLAGFAPPTILSQAARLQARQPFFNLVVTNVPGPQFPLYLLGRRLQVLYPVVPLAQRQALGIAVMSYDGHLGFGLLGDYDALPGPRGDRRWTSSGRSPPSRAPPVCATVRAHPARRASRRGRPLGPPVSRVRRAAGPPARAEPAPGGPAGDLRPPPGGSSARSPRRVVPG